MRRLCGRLGLEFESSMLNWPKGRRDSDGVWAKYWYESVWNSTGFAAYQEKPLSLGPRDARIAVQARPYYVRLYRYCVDG